MHHWCQDWGLQAADAEDVTQSLLLKLVHTMTAFEYDPDRSFRAWLKKATQNMLSDFLTARRRQAASGGDAIVALLDAVEARIDLSQRLEREFDRELLEEAMVRVRSRLTPNKWDAFRLTALEGASGAEAAQRLGMPVATVYTSKSKVQKLLQEEIGKLEIL